MNRSILPLFIPHLGCPHDCVFCNQRAIAAPQAPTPEEVAQAIRQGLQYARRPQVAFYGGSFTAIPAALQEAYLGAAFPFVQDGRCSGIRVSTRPDAIDGQVLARLARYGVQTVELGAQSMDDRVLALSGRGHTARQTRQAARQIQQAGFELVLQMMAGLPGDSRATCRQTARQIAALQPTAARLYPVCVVEHTALCRWMEQGRYQPLTVEEAAEWCADAVEELEGAGVPVVRIGLNPTQELAAQVRGGAYHPAMGQIVRSRILRRQAAALLDGLPPGEVTVAVPKGQLSTFRGQKNENIKWLAKNYPHLQVKVVEEDRLPHGASVALKTPSDDASAPLKLLSETTPHAP